MAQAPRSLGSGEDCWLPMVCLSWRRLTRLASILRCSKTRPQAGFGLGGRSGGDQDLLDCAGDSAPSG